MAVVREGITSNGVRYRIHDDAYADASPEELARRRAAANAVAHRILVNWAKNHPGETYQPERKEETA